MSSYQSSGTMALLEWRHMLNVRPTRISVYSQQCWSVTGLSLRHHAHGPPSLRLLNVWRIWHKKKKKTLFKAKVCFWLFDYRFSVWWSLMVHQKTTVFNVLILQQLTQNIGLLLLLYAPLNMMLNCDCPRYDSHMTSSWLSGWSLAKCSAYRVQVMSERVYLPVEWKVWIFFKPRVYKLEAYEWEKRQKTTILRHL